MEKDKIKTRWKLSRHQKKSGTSILVAIILGILAYFSYTGENVELAFGFGILAIVALLYGGLD